MRFKNIFSFFLCFILSIQIINAGDDSEKVDLFANFEGLPSTIINGSVNVISGVFIETSPTITIPGTGQPSFEATYSHNNYGMTNFCNNWTCNHGGEVLEKIKDEELKFNFYPCNSFKRQFLLSNKKKNLRDEHTLSLNAKCLEGTGFTNTARGVISGKTNVRNEFIKFRKGAEILKIFNGDGSVYTFGDRKYHWDSTREECRYKFLNILFPDRHAWYYQNQGENVCRVDNVNVVGETCGILRIDRNLDQENPHIKITADGGAEQTFSYRKPEKIIYKISSNRHPTITYDYEGAEKHYRINTKHMPLDRSLKIEYYCEGRNHFGNFHKELKHHKKGAKSINRVGRLSAPIGSTGKPLPAFCFSYELDGLGTGVTYVDDAHNNRKAYKYEDHKLTSIQYFNGKEVAFEENYLWFKEGTLKYKTISDGKIAQAAIFYKYDKKGNVLEQMFQGNLTGQCGHNQNGIMNAPCYLKKFTYTHKNCIKSEEDNRKKVVYEYHEETDVPNKKFIYNGNTIALRHFYVFDENGALSEKIIDDGFTTDVNDLSGVTHRFITSISNRKSFPHGLSEEIVEKCMDMSTGSIQMISKKTFSYTNQGLPDVESTYDCNGNFVKSLFWKYDQRGNVIEETNPIGQIVYRQYDEIGNLVYEKGACPEVHKEYQYDFSDRLIGEEEVYTNGNRLKKSYRYDLLGNKVADVDVYGNETRYWYDRLSRLAETQSPEGERDRFEYNFLGHQTAHIDAFGNVTRKEFTIRGQPSKITYPDGRVEKRLYDLDGTLLETTKVDGTVIKEVRDYQDRITEKAVYSREGTFLFKTQCEYNAFHLINEIDAAGNVTHYDYDAAGRQIRVSQGESVKETSYDSMGRPARVVMYASDNDGMVIEYEYDLMDRVILERTLDFFGNIQKESQFQYDWDGNRCATITSGVAGVSVSREEFNFHKTVVRSIDPEGRETITHDRFDYYNEYGQRVAYTEVIDPMGHKSIRIKDVSGKDAHLISKDALGNTLHETFFKYDARGCKIERNDHVYHDQEKVREVVTQWEYDSSGRVIRNVNAVGTPLQKEMTVVYNSFGEKESVTKCDGTVMSYSYNSRGLLKEIKSLDGSIDYTYEYDILNNPILIEDLTSGTSTVRQYDRYKQVVYEKLANGLEMRYSYDAFGREKKVTLPDHSAIEFCYEGTLLKHINRLDTDDSVKYSHTYEEYDQRGMLLRSAFPKEVGTLSYDYDLIGRVRRTESVHWSEVIAGFDDAGNLTEKTLNDSLGTKNQIYHYDKLYQLISDGDNTYLYDSLHNRIKKNDKENRVNVLNQVTDDGCNTYHYDLNGNMTSISGQTEMSFSYDALDRLTAVESGQNKYVYSYDAKNRRMSKEAFAKNGEGEWSKTSHKLYLYQEKREIGLLSEVGEFEELRILGYSRGAENGAAVALEIDRKVYIPIHDIQGNIATILSETGSVVETYRYSAFGEETIFDSDGNETKTSLNPWRFSSKRCDPETGFVYFGCRYYSQNLGKWISADPLGDRDGPNLYCYVKNSPITSFDSYGLYTEERESSLYSSSQYGELNSRFVSYPPCPSSFASNIAQESDIWAVRGASLEYYSKNFTLPNPLRYIGERVGQRMQGKTISWIPSCFTKTQAFTVNEKGKQPIGCRTLYVPGIFNEVSDARVGAEALSKHCNGTRVVAVCNPSRGASTDLLFCTAPKLGKITPAIRALAVIIENEYFSADLESDNPRIYIHAHSRGALEVKMALELIPESIRYAIHVRTYGGAGIIRTDEGFGSVVNYMNPGDPNLNLNLITYLMTDYITFTDQPKSSNPLVNHAIMGEGYQKAMSKSARDDIKDWECK